MSLRTKSILVILLILIVDQIFKVWIKTNFAIGDEMRVFGNWFILHFTENPGMAFGMNLGSKLFLTLFRIVLSSFIVYYIVRLIRDNYKQSYIYCVALILAGAVGNIFDSLFYGVLFGESTPFEIAAFLPESGGYAPVFMGKVVDMFYFPLFVIPDWMPFLGGEIFFSPVFNIADSAITVGIITLLLFFSHDFNVTLDTYLPKKKLKK